MYVLVSLDGLQVGIGDEEVGSVFLARLARPITPTDWVEIVERHFRGGSPEDGWSDLAADEAVSKYGGSRLIYQGEA